MPRGVLHTPVAGNQVGIVLIETVTTAPTGATSHHDVQVGGVTQRTSLGR